jgi:hypothetical protein
VNTFKIQLPDRTALKRVLISNIALLSSIAIHGTVLGLLALTTWTIGKQASARPQEQEIIPDTRIIEGAEVGAIPKPSLNGEPVRKPNDPQAPEPDGEAWKRPSKALQAAVMGTEPQSPSAIGTGAHSAIGASVGGLGSDAAVATPFGAPGAAAAQAPKTMFMGVSGNARKIVYVCDASGSMVGLKFQSLKGELEKSVRDLVPIQSFNVIFFNEERPIMLTKDLIPASSQNKNQLLTFLTSAEPRRGSDPIPSLRYAMTQKPDLLYLLTDGDFLRDGTPINDQVIRELQWLNRDKHVKINTIAFPSGSGEGQEDYLKTLKQIAADSGGVFREVASGDLKPSGQ